ncbi:right-handed parallel beta-helix repeat-containing protein [Haladaptatus sp. DFWS20]|uniref:right-handed parallel beta-helix repeat-containing protein n=1 Tax=Haladaptatus sp. DFWS20 TaxID=3403467 RepID=UPI003EB7718F
MRNSSPTESFAVLFVVLLVSLSVTPWGGLAETAGMGVTAPAQTQIDSCTVISKSGVYALSSDIDDSAAGTCIRIRANDVVLDGRGHALDGIGNNGTNGLIVRGSANVTIRNLSATEWGTGIEFTNSADTMVRNVVAADNGRTGIRLVDATNTTLTNVTATDNVAPALSPFPGPSKSAGIFVADSRDIHLFDANVSRNVGGVSLVNTSNAIVGNSVATANEVGFFVRGANDTVRGSVAAGNNVGFFADNATDSSFVNVSAVSNRVGVGVENTTTARLNDGNASSNFLGVSVVRSRGVSVVNTTAASDFVGINFLESERSTVVESEIRRSEFIGVGMVETTATRLSNTTVETTVGNESVPGATSAGLYLNGSATRLDGVTVADNENWTIFAERDSNLDARRVSLDGTPVSFDGADFALDSTTRPPTPSRPSERVIVGQSFVVSQTTTDGSLDVRIGYDRRATSRLNIAERTLRLWRYNGSWSEVCESRVTPERHVVSATLTRPERAVFSVVGERTESGTDERKSGCVASRDST